MNDNHIATPSTLSLLSSVSLPVPLILPELPLFLSHPNFRKKRHGEMKWRWVGGGVMKLP